MTTEDAPLIDSRLKKPDRPIALIGMMGCGKSTIGKRLAAALDIPFIDSDHAIEDAAGCTIPEIFAQYGESEFRDGERRVIARLVDGQPKVIATGGGAFMQAETRQLLLDKAIVIWLDAELDTLVERVGRRAGRPLLDGKNPRDVLAMLLKERNPVYAQAHIRIPSKPVPHEAAVRAIVEALNLYDS
ncbi:shikimate kinase [Aquisediminimonas sediminicola]|uniref:shikimate kinase n=1 Tax=Alteraquisediminimonas sediminicola TaxID=2676787 RepID=UPI001C8D444F|nr:shikimate kinase [Aquisediminimonas sediminicola]